MPSTPDKLSPNQRRQLNIFTIRFYRYFSEKIRKLLILQFLLSRAAMVRVLLGALLLGHLNIQPALADQYVFVPYNPLTGVIAKLYSNPVFVDIDGDDDLDVFVGGDDGIHYFTNTGTSSRPTFAVEQLNPFGLPDFEDIFIGSGYAPDFVDIDHDNDFDLFIGGNFFENIGNAKSPAFREPRYQPFGLKDTAHDPAFVDIDGDGDFDVFYGSSYGYLIYYKNNGTVHNPVFSGPQLSPFGLTSVYSRSSPTFADIDGDGDYDAFVGDRNGDTTFFENVGNARNPAFGPEQVNPFGVDVVPNDSTPDLADIDSDGDLDLFIGNKSGMVIYFENLGNANSPTFAFQGNPFNLENGDPSFVDIDNDGDLDAFVGNKIGEVLYCENIGSATQPRFDSAQTVPFGLSSSGRFVFADIDNDNDPDAFSIDNDNNVLYFENEGNAQNPSFGSPQPDPFGLQSLARQFVDIDGDGDLDAFFGSGEGDILFQENVGSAINPVFGASQTNPFGLAGVSSISENSRPFFADIDHDGDLDAFTGEATGNTIYFENMGDPTVPAFDTPQINPFGLKDIGGLNYSVLVDINGDGNLDIFVTENASHTFYFQGAFLDHSTYLPLIIRHK